MTKNGDHRIGDRYRIASVIRTDKAGTLYRTFSENEIEPPLGLYVTEFIKNHKELKESDHFKDRLRLAKNLNHPYLLSVKDGGITDEGAYYHVFEWSAPWGNEIGTPPKNPNKITDIIIKLCHVFIYIHSHGIIHGNLSPLNIVFHKDEMKIFGFLGLMGNFSQAQIQNTFTTPYSAPEMLKGDFGDLRSDLYSIGAIWFSFLVGEPPSSDKGKVKENSEKLKDAIQAHYEIPQRIEGIIHRLISHSRDGRFQSAREVVAAINDFVNNKYDLLASATTDSLGIQTRFIGRREETDLLMSMVDDDACSLFVISGEGGVGKTRLLNEVADLISAMDGFVARGQCVVEEGIAYFPLREVMRKLIQFLEAHHNNTLPIAEMQISVLASLIPELWDKPYLKGKVPPMELASAPAEVRLNDAIYQVFEAVAKIKPTLIIIEDIQWADEATQKLLNWITRLRGDNGLLICATCQTDKKKSETLKIIPGLKEYHLHLRPFTALEMQTLASSMLSISNLPQSFIDKIHETSRGNIFFTKTLIRVFIEEREVFKPSLIGWQYDAESAKTVKFTRRMDHLASRHLKKISYKTREILNFGTIFGMVFWDGGLKELSGYSKEEVNNAMGEAMTHELIFERPISTLHDMREFSFTHLVVLKVSYQKFAPDVKQRYHAKVANWLKRISQNRIEEFLGPIADHYEKAGQDKEALNYLMQAGGQAAAQFANNEAIDYLNRALKVTPDDAWLERYAVLMVREEVYLKKGQRKEQLQDIKELQKLADVIDDDQRRVEVLERRVTYKEMVGDYEGAIDDINVLIDFSRMLQDIRVLVKALDSLGTVLWRQGKLEESKNVLERAFRLSQAASIRNIEADVARILGNVTAELRDYEKTIYYYDKALTYDIETANLANECTQLMNTGLIFVAWGDYVKARSYLEQSHKISRKIGHTRILGFIMVNLAEMETLFENYEKALAYADKAIKLGEEIDHIRIQSYAWMFKGDALLGLKRYGDATKALNRAYALKKEMGQNFEMMKIITSLSMIALCKKDFKKSKVLIDEVLAFEAENTLIGASEPSRVYVMCYHILYELWDDRANDLIVKAYGLLEDHSKHIKDPKYKQSYFENVIHNKIIVDIYKKIHAETPDIKKTPPKIEKVPKQDTEKTKEMWIKECQALRKELAEAKGVIDYYKQAEEAMWESEKRSRFSAENASDAIIIFDGKENVLFWNKAAYNIFGYSAEEARNRLVVSLLIRHILDAFKDDIDRLTVSESPIRVGKNMEVMGLRKDGTEFPLEISLSVYKKKQTVYFTAIGRDITERQRVEQALKQAKNEAEHANSELKSVNRRLEVAMAKSKEMAIKADSANQAKSEFLANMSHEIRTPMNAIIGMTHLTLDTELNREQKENLKAVRTSADNLLTLINDILDFSKIEAGHLEIEDISFDLRLTLDAVADTLAIKAHEKGLELIAHIQPEVPEQLIGDPGRLRQILLNLGGNAIKFTEKGEVFITCETEKKMDGRVLLHLSVNDTGIGISDAAKDAIFESFKQADGSVTRKFGGTGLGLSISKLLSEKMGGSIWVESIIGKGSSFHFTVNLGIQTEAVRNIPYSSLESISGKRALIVDDNEKNRMVLKEMMVKWNVKFMEAESGEQALDIMNDWLKHDIRFDIVFMDASMIGMDGFETSRRIRTNPAFEKCILFMLTSMGLRGDASYADSLGISAYILKPIKEAQLLEAISLAFSTDPKDLAGKKQEMITQHSLKEHRQNKVLNILLAEDNDINRKMAIKLIEKIGHKVTPASNGEEAISLNENNDFDIILMDVQMPIMDGLTATQNIRKQSSTQSNIPIVAMTAYAMKGDKEKCLDAGMNDYISKPIDPEELKLKLKKWAGITSERLADKP